MIKRFWHRVLLWAAVIVGTGLFLYFKVREWLPGKPVVVDPDKEKDATVEGLKGSDEEVAGKLEGASATIEHMTKEEVIREFKKAFGVSPTQPTDS